MIVNKFFRPDFTPERPFFYEGPNVKYAPIGPSGSFHFIYASLVSPHSLTIQIINSGSIDTSGIDAYRQGVEISDIKHYDAGLVKIHAGEPGHVLPRRQYGYGTSFRHDQDFFEEIDLFDPVEFIKAQGDVDQFYSSSYTITWPIVTKDYNASDNYEFDGVIEPLVIRAAAAFFSIDVPFETHTIRGELMGGNTNPVKAANQIKTVDYFDPSEGSVPYLDLIDMLGNVPMEGFFNSDQRPLSPFVDERLPRDHPLSDTYEDDLGAALSAVYVSGSESITYASTDTYVKYNQIAATSGFTYDAVQGVGTDSLSFGGLTF